MVRIYDRAWTHVNCLPVQGSSDRVSDLEAALDALAGELGPLQGEPVPLEGGLTNRNFRACFGRREVVVRLPGRHTDLLGIDRAAESAAARAAARLGIGPEVVAVLEEPACLVCELVPGSPLAEPDVGAPGTLERLAGALSALHRSGEHLPCAFDGHGVVRAYAATTRERGGRVPADYERALATADRIATSRAGARSTPVPCHNDLLAANVLVRDADLWIVDWEYAGMGDPFFDLGNLAVNNGLDEGEEERLLKAYLGRTPRDGDRATLGLMRFMSDFREAMWGVVQGTASDLDFDFHGYARDHFERLEATAQDRRLGHWLAEVGAPDPGGASSRTHDS